jgi:hypothetical protein
MTPTLPSQPISKQLGRARHGPLEAMAGDLREVIAAYLKARGAILCDEKPVAWSNPEHMFLDDRMSTLTASKWRPTEKDTVALYTALPETLPKSP